MIKIKSVKRHFHKIKKGAISLLPLKSSSYIEKKPVKNCTLRL
ncbi:hypothetical protein EPYR_00747 [Erwinia pyrifoliae DSM 12163]|nr:hypothetical protein EPYR_00747 [Erwinia pyrifoliae DSM 12163]